MDTPPKAPDFTTDAPGVFHAAHGSAALDYEQWEKQGGDTDGITRTVCHGCDRMWPMAAMTEDDRFDNICPSCMAERQNDPSSATRP